MGCSGSSVLWDEAQMRWHSQQRVAEAMGEPEGVLRCDASGFVNKGHGLWGSRGSTAAPARSSIVQSGVFAADASRQGYALVDKRLFLPDAWWTDAYAAQRTTCHLPNELGCLAAMGGDDVAGHRPCRAPPVEGRRRMAFMARARTCSTPWTRVSASRRSSRFRRKRAAGANAPERRTRPTPIQETCAPSVWWSPPPTPQAPWRRWRHTCLRRAGLSAPFQKGPRPIGYACPPPRDPVYRGPAGPDRLARDQADGEPTPCPHTLSVMRQRARPGAPLSGSVVGDRALLRSRATELGMDHYEVRQYPAGTTIC